MLSYCATLTKNNFNFATSPAHYWGLRKVNPSYTGAIVKVRRSSDDATTDVYPLFNELDEVTLLRWAGNDTIWVHTVYDQYGANNLVQTDPVRQPKLGVSGAIYKQKNKPCIYFDNFDSSNRYMDAATASDASPNTINVVAKSVSSSFNGRIFDGVTSRNFLDVGGTSKYRMSAGTQQDMANADTNYNILTAVFNGASSKLYVNGTANNAPASINTNALEVFRVGASQNTLTFFEGYISDIFYFSGAISDADRIEIEREQKRYFAID